MRRRRGGRTGNPTPEMRLPCFLTWAVRSPVTIIAASATPGLETNRLLDPWTAALSTVTRCPITIFTVLSFSVQHEALRSFEGAWSNAVIGSIASHRASMSNSSTTSVEAGLSTQNMRTSEPQNRPLGPINPAWNCVTHQPVIFQGAPRSNVYMRTNSPPPICTKGSTPVQKHLRSEDDEYTASWTCGAGNERAGWCRLCHSWCATPFP